MKLSILFTMLCIPILSISQDTLTTYYDRNWDEVEKNEAYYTEKAFKVENRKWKAIDYYPNGRIEMEGFYTSRRLKKENGKFINYYKNGEKESEGVYKNGEKHNEWIWYFKNGLRSSKELYDNGNLISYNFWNEDGSKIEGKVDYETMPIFKGGDDALMTYLNENVVYPKEAQEKGISGRVFVDFIVGYNGEVEEIEVTKSRHPILSSEAVKVVSQMPNWIPGKFHNKLARVSFRLPIKFEFK